jgi:hypothetical protein
MRQALFFYPWLDLESVQYGSNVWSKLLIPHHGVGDSLAWRVSSGSMRRCGSLSVEIQHQDMAVKSASKTLAIAQDGYQLGIDSYLNVLAAQTTLLPNQKKPVNLRIQQMTAMDFDLVAHLFEGLQAEGVAECVVGLGFIIRDEGFPGRIGSLNLVTKRGGERSAGNLHSIFEAAGAGNGVVR